jgi:hypothetical protein
MAGVTKRMHKRASYVLVRKDAQDLPRDGRETL